MGSWRQAGRSWAGGATLSLIVATVLMACGADTRSGGAGGAPGAAPAAAPARALPVAASEGGGAYPFERRAAGVLGGLNPTHQVDVALSDGAISLTRGGAEGWQLGLRWTGLGRADRIAAVQRPDREADVGEGRASYHREDSSEEWFESSPRGVEHGFVLAAPPEGTRDAPLTIEVRVEGGLSPSLAPGGQWVDLDAQRGTTVARYSDLSARDADGKALRSWFEVAGGAIRLRVDDAGARYPLEIDPTVWTLQQEVTATPSGAGDWFGFSVAVSGALAVVGAPNHAGVGAAYVFSLSGSTWTQQATLQAGDAAAGDSFGSAVSISGTTIVVGAPSHKVGTSAGAGAAYVFTQSSGTWTQAAELKAGDAAAGDAFGTSVSVDGGTALVGAPNHAVSGKAGAGAAYVFGGATWTQQAEPTAGDAAAGDAFGTSVSVSSGTALVGAPYHTVGTKTEAGAAYVFTQGSAWAQQAEPTASDAAAFDAFGTSVSVSSGTALVGAPNHKVGSHSDAGAAYVFSQNGAAWPQFQELTAGDAALADLFGFSVSVSGTNAIVGAYQHDVSGVESAGAAYLFSSSCTSWTLANEITAADGATADFFGYSVAVGSTTAIAGAYQHNVGANVSAGAAYLYNGVTSAPTTCCISGTTYASGTVNPANACQVCTPATSSTSWSNEPNGTTCDDGNSCTTGDSCQAGTCTGTAVTCTASDQCHVAGVCNPATGTCSNPTAPNGTTCNDGNACTTGDSCQAGTCTGTSVTCTASDQCHVAGVCNPATGTCSNPTAPNGTTCNDGNACTTGDSCQAGTCTGTSVTCTASDQCHVAGTCNPATGTCSNPTAPNGTTCNDGNSCTTGDSCQAGTCTGTSVTCTASDQCHVAGTCDPTTGTCSNPTVPDGTTCNDGNSCTQTDTCQAGTCTGTSVTCTASDACHVAGTCDQTSGTCSNPTAPDGTACAAGEVCSSGTCVADCFISGVLYPDGTVNPGNPCQVCTAATSTTTWSNVSDGTFCASGEVCSNGTCTADCFIGGVLYADGTTNPTNPCQVCTAATSTTTWSDVSDGTACATGEVCSSGICAADCFIGGTLYAPGAVNPSNPCQVCTPAISTTTWSNGADGAACAAGEVCSSGTCVADCFINGVLYADGTVDPGNPCQVCTAATSTTTWSNESDGTDCGNGQVCSGGACGSECFIDGTIYATGAVNPKNPCEVCAPGTSTSSWSDEPDGTGCATGEVCSSGACVADCFIDGVLYPDGTANPANPCQVCTAAASTTTWSNVSDGTGCATGEVCSGGTCAADCFIDGAIVAGGTVNAQNPCQVCTPATSTTTWSNVSDGTSCGNGQVCSGGTCGSECFIGGVIYPSGTLNPANPCQVCAPGTSTTAWSNEPAGTGCGTGVVCNATGSCVADCFINGTLYASGAANPANACQVCAPSTSTTTWSNASAGTSCGSGVVCNATGSCAADCFINGTLYASGAANPANACQVCAPATSTTTWSNASAGTSCGNGVVCSSGSCVADCFINGTLYTAGTSNPANACQVCTPSTSTTTWSTASDGTSCGSGVVCSAGSCVADCFINGTLYTAGASNPANPCQVCAPPVSTTTWSTASDGTSCGSGVVCSAGSCVADCFIKGTLYAAGTVNSANDCQVCDPATSTTDWSNEPDGTTCSGGTCSSGTCVSGSDGGSSSSSSSSGTGGSDAGASSSSSSSGTGGSDAGASSSSSSSGTGGSDAGASSSSSSSGTGGSDAGASSSSSSSGTGGSDAGASSSSSSSGSSTSSSSSSSSSGTGGSDAGTSSSSSSSGGTGGTSTTSSGNAGSAGSDTGGSGSGLTAAGGGCGCQIPGETPRGTWLVGLIPLLVLRRRRERGARRAA